MAACAVALLALSPLPLAAADDDDAGPVVLTNADVARLHAKPGSSDDAARQDAGADAGLAAVGAAREPEDLVEALDLEADLRARLDRISRQSMGSVEESIDARVANASQQELQARAMQSSPPVTAPAAPMPDGSEDADSGGPAGKAPAPEEAEVRPMVPETACMYGTRGRLLYEPEGRSCAAIRAKSQRTFESGASAAKGANKHESVGCVYGSRAQLLYSSPGVQCAKLEDDQ